MEKEALGLTWACERFKDFLICEHFVLQTDHKPLLSLLGAQDLDTSPPRIQRFGMRLMRYSYKDSLVLRKTLWTAEHTIASTTVCQHNNSNRQRGHGEHEHLY